MAYILISFNDQEIERRDLAGAVVVGRSPECQVPIRDILLSRRHIRLEPTGGGWIVRDLGSKNGSMVNDDPLHDLSMLRDGDVVRLGRVRITYKLGRLASAGLRPTRSGPQRPADPMEALSGTISGFKMLEPGEGECHEDMPLPQPEPKRPAAFDRDDVYSLLTTIASSSWDSIYAQAQQPLLKNRRDTMDTPRPKLRPRSPIDLSLQVCAATDYAERRPRAPRTAGRAASVRWRRMIRRASRPNARVRRRLPVAAMVCWMLVYGVLALKGTGAAPLRTLRPTFASAISFSDSMQTISLPTVPDFHLQAPKPARRISLRDPDTAKALLTAALPLLAGGY